MPVQPAKLDNKEEALVSWHAACSRLDQALLAMVPALPLAKTGGVDNPFDATLRALYALETAFFPDRIFSEDPVARKRERAKSLAAKD